MCSGWRGKSHVCDEAEVGAGAGDRDVSGGGASSVVIYTPILMELFFTVLLPLLLSNSTRLYHKFARHQPLSEMPRTKSIGICRRLCLVF